MVTWGDPPTKRTYSAKQEYVPIEEGCEEIPNPQWDPPIPKGGTGESRVSTVCRRCLNTGKEPVLTVPGVFIPCQCPRGVDVERQIR